MHVTRLVVSFGLAVDQCVHAELLREPLELTDRCGALQEIDEVRLHAPFGEEPKRLPGVRIFLHAKNLNFHNAVDAWSDDATNYRTARLVNGIACASGNLPRW